jgi:protein arginine kinase
MSEEFAEADNPRGLFVTHEETYSMMINEEDHLRMQTLFSGFSLDKAWYAAHQLDHELSKTLDYAYSGRFGYLTACPTNVGTGVRFSVFIHLPVLAFTKEIDRLFANMIPAGITVRGFYGEGSKVIGNFFQISNQYTLGWTEQGILDRVIPLIKSFIQKERESRSRLLKENRILLEDKIFRAVGLISQARILSSLEFLELLSALRLGVDLGIIKGMEKKAFNDLMVNAQPAHIQKRVNKELSEVERDAVRATMVRERLHLN